MSNTVFKALMMAALSLPLSGCGLYQGVSESTVAASRSLFHEEVRTLHLDFSARAGMNLDVAEMNALSVPTLVRIYQLRDDKIMQRTDYDNVISQGAMRLRSDLLDEQAVVVRPHESVQLDTPLHPDAQFVAVVGLFRQPDLQGNGWRLVLARDELDPERARVIELQDHRLGLQPLGRK